MLQSSRYGVNYPSPDRSDSADVPRDFASVVAGLEASAMYGQGTFAARPVSTPGSPGKQGRLYAATDQNPQKVYYDYGTGWFEIGAQAAGAIDETLLATSVLNMIVPVGGSISYGGSADPAGGRWLLEDGRSLLRSAYPALFTVIGVVNGAVDGTHFNIPDSRGRVDVGVDGAAGRLAGPDALGASGGEEKHQMTVAEMASHTHIQNPHAHAALSNYFADTQFIAQVAAGSAFAAVNDNHNVTAGQTAINQNTGGDTPHNNMQPYIVKNKIMRVL